MERIINRFRVFETNSSSAHAISLSGDTVFSGAATDYLPIVDNTVVIDSCYDYDFGWGEEEYNDPESKLIYLLSYCNQNYCEYTKDYKRISTQESVEFQERLKKIIKEFLLVDDVIFSLDFNNLPNIDHQSTDTADYVVLDDEAIKDFIFNPKSVLYISNDNGGMENEDIVYFRATYVDNNTKVSPNKLRIQVKWTDTDEDIFEVSSDASSIDESVIGEVIGDKARNYYYDFSDKCLKKFESILKRPSNSVIYIKTLDEGILFASGLALNDFDALKDIDKLKENYTYYIHPYKILSDVFGEL